jgi:hypothetical protein
MARINTLRLLRARLADLPRRPWTRSPWLLALFLAADLVELAASLALAAVSPPAAARAHVAYAAFDVPYVAPPVTAGVAFIGMVAGLAMGASLIAELVVLFRRAQIMRYRHGPLRAGRRPWR